MIRKHLCGIGNATALRTTNAGSEYINSKVLRVKRAAADSAIAAASGARSCSTSDASTSIPPVPQLTTQLPDAPRST